MRSHPPFCLWLTTRFEVSWATTHCRAGDAGHVVSYLAEHANPEERDQIALLARRIRPTAFRVMKTEIFLSKLEHSWVWIEDSPLQAERNQLELHGWSSRLLRIDTCAEPDALLRAHAELETY